MFLKSYEISLADLKLSIVTGLSGRPYAIRHWEAAAERSIPGLVAWGHRVVALLEFIPILGGLLALIERVVFSCYCFTSTNNGPSQSTRKEPSRYTKDDPTTPLKAPLKALERVNVEEAQEHLNRLKAGEGSIKQTAAGVTVTSEISFDD